MYATRHRKPPRDGIPVAARYAALRGFPASAVREAPPTDVEFPYTERHLRVVWFDPAYRPPALRSQPGEAVRVENPGRWNLEAGPDFLDAVLRLGPEQRRVAGDVEIHVQPADWRRHGHAADPRYRRVVAHVTYAPGRLPPGELPAGAVEIALRETLQADPAFSFESMDLAAYPFAALDAHPPCRDVLLRFTPEQKAAVLETAGEERLRRKAERMAAALERRGPEQVLYEEIMAALGFKHNRRPFRVLTGRVPVEALREAAGGEPEPAYALLCGVAGLLPVRPDPRWDDETRRFIRRLWDTWWRLRDRWQGQVMPRQAWSLSGVRPANHPLRRLMAAACLFADRAALAPLAGDPSAAPGSDWPEAASRFLQGAGSRTYWSHRLGLLGERRRRATALIGPGRAAAILANALVPFRVACRTWETGDGEVLRHLPPEDDNSLVRVAGHAILGRDQHPALYRTGLRQQGLLQIHQDFCLNSRTGCRDCPLPAALAGWGV